MKQLDSQLERRLNWLLAPLVVIAVLVVSDLLFEWGLGADVWGTPAMIGCVLLPAVGFSIAYIRHRCWGLLAFCWVFILLMLLNMSNFFVDLFLG